MPTWMLVTLLPSVARNLVRTAALVFTSIASPCALAEGRDTIDTAVINDTIETRPGSPVYFAVVKINGEDVDCNSISKTRGEVFWRGYGVLPNVCVHKVKAGNTKFTLYAGYYKATLDYVFHQTPELTAEVEFAPQAGQTYIVAGELYDDRRAVWIEDLQGAIVAKVANGETNQAKREPVAAQNAKGKFELIRLGEVLSTVKQRLGEPTSIEALPGQAIPTLGENRKIEARYADLGVLRFAVPHNSQFEHDYFNPDSHPKRKLSEDEPWLVRKISSRTHQPDLFSEIATLIEFGDARLLRALANADLERGTYDEATLDRYAQRAWIERHTTDRYMIDAVALTLRLLGTSRSARYNQYFAQMKAAGPDEKILDYVEKYIDTLPATSVPQFIPADSEGPTAPSGDAPTATESTIAPAESTAEQR